MPTSSAFEPDWVSPPGDTIMDILKERNISVAEFGKRMGQTAQEVNDLIDGRLTISIAVARALQSTLGGSVEFWISRDFHYREDSVRLDVTEDAWLRELPLSDMIKNGWLKPIPHPSEEFAACLDFFGVPDLAAWRSRYGRVLDMV